MGDRTRTTVIAVVTSVWAVNFAAGLFPPLRYEPDQAINGIFMTIVGGLFALGARKGGPPAPSGGAHAADGAPPPPAPPAPPAPSAPPDPPAPPAPPAPAADPPKTEGTDGPTDGGPS